MSDDTDGDAPPAGEPDDDRDTATATEAPPEKETEADEPASRHLPPWKVLLHNDDVNDMLDVVQTIVMLTPLGKTEAVGRMLEAHHEGVALLLTTHRERAELYRDQFRSRRLMVTVEPAEE